ncbi:MAG: D-alanine--D-alanine ligase [Gammaproteobacteria bacterium]|nr:D-alanine--D-alanine ligase [Gammaproteobacteria bacterium]
MNPQFFTEYKETSEVRIASSYGKQHIALIYGGMSAERDVSKSSAKGIEKTLVEIGYQVTAIDMGADIAQVLAQIKPDVVFNALHGTYGEDGCLPGLLNIMRIPYTHSGVLSSALAFDKVKSKEMFFANHIQQAKSLLVSSSMGYRDDPLPRPYVIKPMNQGSSVGVELVFDEDEFKFADYKFPYGDVLIEEYIRGREMQVAVLNGEALGALEIQLINKRFYDYEAKYTEGYTRHLMPAPIASTAYENLLALAEKAYKVLDCNGMARVEFIYQEEKNEFFILEVNTHPGFTPLSLCPEIANAVGITFPQLLEEMLASAKCE